MCIYIDIYIYSWIYISDHIMYLNIHNIYSKDLKSYLVLAQPRPVNYWNFCLLTTFRIQPRYGATWV